MAQQDLRTYRRRGVTRESGYHTCNDTTGGECRIIHAKRYLCDRDSVTFVFHRPDVDVVELFEKGISIIAFGGFVHSAERASVSLELRYFYEGQEYHTSGKDWEKTIEADSWSNVGIHAEQVIDLDARLVDVLVNMTVTSRRGNVLDFVSFDLDTVSKEDFLDPSCAVSFYQKTRLHIPYLYYLRTDLPVERYLTSPQTFTEGKRVVLKSCNRCGRYLPINVEDELKTLGFSLHCKKRAPCVPMSLS